MATPAFAFRPDGSMIHSIAKQTSTLFASHKDGITMVNSHPFSAFKLFLLVLIAGMVVACNPTPPTAEEPTNAGTGAATQAAPADESYPSAQPTQPDPTLEAYPAGGVSSEPVPAQDPYPAEEESDIEAAFVFDIYTPIEAGNTTVTGQAPPNLALTILDMTFNGATLGSGSSDASGQFDIAVSELPAGHRIGILLSESDGGLTYQETLEKYFPYVGDGALNVPNIGLLFDTELVP